MFSSYLVSVPFAMDYVRYELIHSARNNVQNGDANDAQTLSLRYRIVIVGQVQHRCR